MRWYLSVGAWGDMLAHLGLAQQDSLDPFGFCYYWHDPDIATFLAAQPQVAAVRHLCPPSWEAYVETHQRLWNGGRGEGDRRAWLAPLLAGTGLDWRTVRYFPTLFPARRAPIARPVAAVLPEAYRVVARDRVAALRQDGCERVLLVHPFSLTSTRADAHWPHWQAAWNALAARQRWTLLLTGLPLPDPPVWTATPTARNLIGQTPSLLDVYALADACDGIVTTSNSLAMWSLVVRRPAVVCLNQTMMDRSYYFRRWIEADPNRLVPADAPLSDFLAAADALFAEPDTCHAT